VITVHGEFLQLPVVFHLLYPFDVQMLHLLVVNIILPIKHPLYESLQTITCTGTAKIRTGYSQCSAYDTFTTMILKLIFFCEILHNRNFLEILIVYLKKVLQWDAQPALFCKHIDGFTHFLTFIGCGRHGSCASMPRCQGLPDGPCPSRKNDSTVRIGEGEFMLCKSCDVSSVQTIPSFGVSRQ